MITEEDLQTLKQLFDNWLHEAMKPTIAILCMLSLASCASMNIDTGAIRTVPALIGLDGVSQDKAEGLVKRFNAEAIQETGIILDASYIPFSMSRQKEIWPKCEHPLYCFADYTTHKYNWMGRER